MPRSSKPQPDAPTGPRLVKQTTPKVKPSAAQPELSHEQIAMRAYELFQQDGGVHGQHVDHWLRAESELKAFTQAPSKRATATRARG